MEIHFTWLWLAILSNHGQCYDTYANYDLESRADPEPSTYCPPPDQTHPCVSIQPKTIHRGPMIMIPLLRAHRN